MASSTPVTPIDGVMMGNCTPQYPMYFYSITPDGDRSRVRVENADAAAERDEALKRTRDAAGLTDDNASPSKKLRVAAPAEDQPFHVVPFDASREWWSFTHVGHSHDVVSMLFDPVSVSAATRDGFAAFISDNSDAVWDIYQVVVGDETDQLADYGDQIHGAWSAFPSNEHLKASKECVKITASFIETFNS